MLHLQWKCDYVSNTENWGTHPNPSIRRLKSETGAMAEVGSSGCTTAVHVYAEPTHPWAVMGTLGTESRHRHPR